MLGQNLSIEMQGDVRLLQRELLQLGFSLHDEERFFDEAARKAMPILQLRNSPEAPGDLEKQESSYSAPRWRR
jgi:hypothetical protein